MDACSWLALAHLHQAVEGLGVQCVTNYKAIEIAVGIIIIQAIIITWYQE